MKQHVPDQTPPPAGTAAGASAAELAGFNQALLDSLSAHICVLAEDGTILAVNQAWRAFAAANPPRPANAEPGANYLAVCEAAVGEEAAAAQDIVRGFRAVAQGDVPEYSLEYPCHSADTLRWFRLRATRFAGPGPVRVVIEHLDITERKRAEEALRESERKFYALFETMSEGIVYEDCEGKIISANPAAERLLGLSLDQMQGRTSFDPRWKAIHPDGSPFPGETHSLHVAATTGKPSIDEVMGIYNPQTDTYVWLKVNSTPEFLPGEKKPFRAYAVFWDITERKQVEDVFDRFFEQPAGLNLIARLDGVIHRVNQGLEDLLGYGRGGLAGLNFLDIVHPDDRAATIAEMGKLAQGINTLYFENRYRQKSGKYRFLGWSATAGVLSEDHMILAVAIDITDRKLAEEALRESVVVLEKRNSFINTILENLAFGLAVHLMDSGVTQYTNPAYSKVYGWPAEEMRDVESFFKLIYPDPDFRAQQLKMVVEDISSGDPERMHWVGFKITTQTGEERYIEARNIPLPDQNLMISTAWDITEAKRSEERLRESEQQFRHLFEHLHAGVVVHASDSQIILANEMACELLGLSVAQMTGKTAIDPAWRFVREDGTALPLDEYPVQRVLSTRGPIRDLVMGVDRPDTKDRVWVLLNAFPEFSADERLLHAVVTFVDITARKQLEELHSQHQMVLEAAAEGILGLDANGMHTFAKPAAATMLGYKVEELLGRPSHSLWHHTRADGSAFPEERCEIHACLRTSAAIKAHSDLFWRKDGTSFPVEYAANPVQQDGRTIGVVLTFADITERKKADEDLRQSRERFELAVSGSNDGIFDWDLRDNSLYLSSRWKEQIGYRDDELKSEVASFVSNLHPDDRPRVTAYLDGYLRGEINQYEIEFRMKSKDGAYRWILARGAALRDARGQPIRMAGSHTDITGRKLAESQREQLEEQLRMAQKMEAIGSLAGGVAHDFNNLVTVILSYAGFAMEELRDGDPLKNDLLEVKNAGERAAALTRQLLAFSRKQVLQPALLNLNQVALGVEKMLRRIIGEDIDFVQVLAPDLGTVKADPGQIEQVLMNLAVNARDAMPEGGKLTIETANVEVDEEYAAVHVGVQPGAYVQLAVSDTGCGMDDQTRARIFEPFFTTKERGKGTGLGLSTVYGIVKQSGGHICVFSELGKGTTFKIYLPREASASTVIRPSAVPRGARGTETILVVEDEEVLRRVTRRSLEAAGYRVLTASDGLDALVVSAEHAGEIDLLLTDVVMPRMSGREVVQELGKTRPTLKIVYMSGYTDDAIVHLGVLKAETHFLAKPFTSADLTRKVREVLDKPAPLTPRPSGSVAT